MNDQLRNGRLLRIFKEPLARLEIGMHDPRLGTLRKLAKALGVPVTELLG